MSTQFIEFGKKGSSREIKIILSHIFERNNYGYQPLWREIRKIYSSDIKPDDYFGKSVDISRYTIIVGSKNHYDVM